MERTGLTFCKGRVVVIVVKHDGANMDVFFQASSRGPNFRCSPDGAACGSHPEQWWLFRRFLATILKRILWTQKSKCQAIQPSGGS